MNPRDLPVESVADPLARTGVPIADPVAPASDLPEPPASASQGVDRRGFLSRVAAAAAGGAAIGAGASGCASAPVTPPQAPSAPRRGPDERLRIGFIGVGGRGSTLLQRFLETGDVEVPIVCDVDQLAINRIVGVVGPTLAHTTRYEDVLARADVDAVVIATPDHWHSPIAIAACRAGKDVYVEKPLSRFVAEGRRVVQAARKYGRVVTLGTQQLSGSHYKQARDVVRGGRLGKIASVRTWNFRNSMPGRGRPADSAPPPTLDWDRWLGPAPVVPYNPLRASGGFRHFWDYAGGVLTDWGVHHFHNVLDIMSDPAKGYPSPTLVSATGGRLALEDITDIPDLLEVNYQFPGWVLTYSNREFNGKAPYGSEYGIELCGTSGTMFLDRRGFAIYEEKHRGEPSETVGKPGVDNFLPENLDRDHVANFLECVRTRRLPASEIESGHKATLLAHLGNISYRLGRPIRWDGVTERVPGDSEADAMLRGRHRRPYVLPPA